MNCGATLPITITMDVSARMDFDNNLIYTTMYFYTAIQPLYPGVGFPCDLHFTQR